jgi:predicted nicotinamide N-methyase
MTSSPKRHLLFQRIHRRYQTITQKVRVADEVEIDFTRIADPDRVLDEVAAEEDRLEKISGRRCDSDQLRLPYWAELWDSALALSQNLCRTTAQHHFSSVLDLGCGMGLTGTVAARLGMKVLFADLEPAALLFAQLNSLPDHQRVRTRRLDWRKDHLDEKFDLILGADILYERKQWDYLEPFWRAHLRDDGVVLLGEPGRQTGDLFVDWIHSRGWSLTLHHEQTPARQVRIFQLRA